MTSKYDQPDASDTDRDDDRPIDVQEVPEDGQPWQHYTGGVMMTPNPDGFMPVRTTSEAEYRAQFQDPLGSLSLAGLTLKDAIDPAEHAYHAAVDAFGTLEKELATCSTTDRAWVLRRLCNELFKRADTVASACLTKLDELTR